MQDAADAGLLDGHLHAAAGLAGREIECRQPASEARRHNKYVSSQAACVASTCSSLLLVSALLLSPTSARETCC